MDFESSQDSLRSFPSLVKGGVVQVPRTVTLVAGRIKRWNTGGESRPRTLHVPQSLARPAVDARNLCDKLVAHSACRGSHGFVHSLAVSGLRGDKEEDSSGEKVHYAALLKRSVHVLHNVQRRIALERQLGDREQEVEEFEKRIWLSTILRTRREEAAQQGQLSRTAHALVREQWDAGNSAGFAASSSSSSSSPISLRSRSTGALPTRRSASPTTAEAAGLAADLRLPRWRKVLPLQGPPPYIPNRSPSPSSPARLSARLSVMDPGCGGSCSVASPALAAAATSEIAVPQLGGGGSFFTGGSHRLPGSSPISAQGS